MSAERYSVGAGVDRGHCAIPGHEAMNDAAAGMARLFLDQDRER